MQTVQAYSDLFNLIPPEYRLIFLSIVFVVALILAVGAYIKFSRMEEELKDIKEKERDIDERLIKVLAEAKEFEVYKKLYESLCIKLLGRKIDIEIEKSTKAKKSK
jgi:hypothetical protein